VQGYFGGWIDLLMQRFIEIWSSMPVLYILLIIASILPPGFWILLDHHAAVLLDRLRRRGARGVPARPQLRICARRANALGVGNATIMYRHLLPNAMVATLTFLPFILAGSITTLTSLDFLGFGMPPGSPSLGELVAQGKNNLQAPWLALTAFVVMSLMLSLLIFVGEATRDAFDPRKTFR
jgi:microcin C transport system permease protein